MLVGGVPIDERLLRELSRVVDRNLARRLDTALLYRAKVLGLTVAEREAILKALENSPPGLEELRAILCRIRAGARANGWRSAERAELGERLARHGSSRYPERPQASPSPNAWHIRDRAKWEKTLPRFGVVPEKATGRE